MINRHGLSRNVPDDIKFRVRRDSYFGCVHCGMAIAVYEHIDPEFSEALEHDPDKMTLLCDTQNQRKERGFVSKETIWRWKKDPWAKRNGHVHDSIDVSSRDFKIWIGGNRIRGFERIITVGDECILSLKPAETAGGPMRLSAIFYNLHEEKILEIDDNEWKASSNVVDLLCVKGKIGIRENFSFILKIICFPPDQIVISFLDMYYKDFHFKADQNGLIIKHRSRGVAQISNRDIVSNGAESYITATDEGLFSFCGNFSSLVLNESPPTRQVTSIKMRRNELCPCESGNKYKNCCIPKYDYDL